MTERGYLKTAAQHTRTVIMLEDMVEEAVNSTTTAITKTITTTTDGDISPITEAQEVGIKGDEAVVVVVGEEVPTPTTDEMTTPEMLDKEEREEKEAKTQATADEATSTVGIEAVAADAAEVVIEEAEEAARLATRVSMITVRVGMTARMNTEAPVVVEEVRVQRGMGRSL